MFWKKKQRKSEVPKERNLFREAFLPPKKAVVQRQPEKRSGRRGFPWVAVLWGVFLVTVVYVLFASPFHSVGDVSVVGAVDIPENRLEAFLRDRMSGKWFAMFPKDNFFLSSASVMERSLLESFPKLRSAEIRKRFPNRVQAIVSERDRIPLWCFSGECFLIGDDGTARDARFAVQAENEAFLFRIEDSGARAIVSGDPVLDEGMISRVLRLEQGIRMSGMVAIVPRAVTPSRVSGEFRFTTTEGWDILANTEWDPEMTIAALRLVLEKEIPEERRAKLRYVDLRTEKKAFYSFIPEEPVSDEASKNTDSDSEKEKQKSEKKK